MPAITKISELLDSFQFVTSLFEEMQRSRACLKNALVLNPEIEQLGILNDKYSELSMK